MAVTVHTLITPETVFAALDHELKREPLQEITFETIRIASGGRQNAWKWFFAECWGRNLKARPAKHGRLDVILVSRAAR